MFSVVTQVLMVLLVQFLGGAPVGGAPDPGPYRPPTERAISDPFDAGLGPYAAGNRGVDYAVSPEDPIAAIGAGVVVFAGQVGGTRWVTVQHPDGLRSSYGHLSEVVVTRGQPVAAGQIIGRSGARFHLGVRDGDRYIDPQSLFDQRPISARLVTPIGSRGHGP